MASYLFVVQQGKRDELYINIADNEGLMKSSPSRGFRSTTAYLLFISNPLQLKLFSYLKYI